MPKKQQQIEYNNFFISSNDSQQLKDLNKLGSIGWILCSNRTPIIIIPYQKIIKKIPWAWKKTV
jgi:hypothetical protein